ncbi:MAG: hypothetical protein GXP33_05030 [Spirochaetes bacterium]|nr:hypothetical protein [Spirochaetota bacterium]
MKNITVSIIGGINIDITGKSKGPVLKDNSNPGTVTIAPGGVACNIARMLACLSEKAEKNTNTGGTGSRFNLTVKLYSAVGNDFFSAGVLKEINNRGIDTSGIIRTGKNKTGTYLSILDQNSEMITAVSDMEIMDAVSCEVIEKWKPGIRGSDFIVADTNLNIDSLNSICKISADYGIPVLVEPVSIQKSLKILRVKHSITYCTPNTEEYLALASESRENLEIGILKGIAHVKKIIITRGRKGVIYFNAEDKKQKHFPVEAVHAVNPNGAGDAFAAGFVYSLLGGAEEADAVKRGIISAADALKSPGAVPEVQ